MNFRLLSNYGLGFLIFVFAMFLQANFEEIIKQLKNQNDSHMQKEVILCEIYAVDLPSALQLFILRCCFHWLA